MRASVPHTSARTCPNSATRSRLVSQDAPGSPSPSSAQKSRRRASGSSSASWNASAPTAPASWPTAHRGRALAQPVEVAAQLVGPGRGLEAEGDRGAGLAVGAPDHDRVAVALGELQHRRLEGQQVAPDDRPDVAHQQAEPRVADVLHGGADVDVLARGLRQHPLQLPDEAERGVRRRPRARRDPVQVERAPRGRRRRSARRPRAGRGRGAPARGRARRGRRARPASGPSPRAAPRAPGWTRGARRPASRSGG